MVGLNKFVSDERPPDISTYELDAEGRDLSSSGWPGEGERDSADVAAKPAALSRAAEGPTT